MKKKIIGLLMAGVVAVTSLPSCTNLDEDVYDKLPADSFGNTMTEVNALVGTVNNSLREYFPSNYFYLSECSGSMAVTPTRLGGDWYDGGQYRELYMHTWTANTSAVKGCWSTAFAAIGTCNATISVLENSKLLSDTQKTSYLAMVRGVRAFWYYTVMDFYGNAPLVTEYSATDKTAPTMNTRQEIFDWLIKEVTELTTQAPDPDATNYGYFTKGAAYMLLAKLYLNAAAWGVNTSNAYANVINACDKVINMGAYSLNANWKDNFTTTNENSKEAIFAACFTTSGTKNTMMYRTLHYKDNLALGGTFGAWNGVCAQPDYVKEFDTSDPRYAGSFLTGQMYNKSTGEALVTAHGRLLNHTVEVTMIPGTEYDGTTWKSVNQEDGARCFKWVYAPDLSNAMLNDFHIFRLADAYLMKAEAILRNGGSGAEAAKYVNIIRERAYGDTKHDYETVDLNKVMLERRFEFAWECMSRQDDIRFGVFEKGMWSSSGCDRKADSYLKIFPVSQDAWQANSNLTQNPGYASFSK